MFVVVKWENVGMFKGFEDFSMNALLPPLSSTRAWLRPPAHLAGLSRRGSGSASERIHLSGWGSSREPDLLSSWSRPGSVCRRRPASQRTNSCPKVSVKTSELVLFSALVSSSSPGCPDRVHHYLLCSDRHQPDVLELREGKVRSRVIFVCADCWFVRKTAHIYITSVWRLHVGSHVIFVIIGYCFTGKVYLCGWLLEMSGHNLRTWTKSHMNRNSRPPAEIMTQVKWELLIPTMKHNNVVFYLILHNLCWYCIFKMSLDYWYGLFPSQDQEEMHVVETWVVWWELTKTWQQLCHQAAAGNPNKLMGRALGGK